MRRDLNPHAKGSGIWSHRVCQFHHSWLNHSIIFNEQPMLLDPRFLVYPLGMTGTCSLISSSNKSSVPSSEISRWVDSNHHPRNFKFPCSSVGIHRVKATSLSLLWGTSCQLVLRRQRLGCTSHKLENQLWPCLNSALWPCLESNQTSPLNMGVLPLIRKVWFSNLKKHLMAVEEGIEPPVAFATDYLLHWFPIVVWTISSSHFWEHPL